MTTVSLFPHQARTAPRLVVALLAAILVLLALGPAPATAWPLWEATTIASSTNGTTAIALDADGHPHVAFAGYRALKVAEWDGSAWRYTTVASPCVYQSADISLALRPDGTLAAVSYYDICTNRVRVGRGVRAQGSLDWAWTILDVPAYTNSEYTSVTEYHSSAVAIDATGGIHVVFAEDTNVYHAVYTTSWSVLLQVDDAAHNAFWDDVSVALDNAGKAHISFISGSGRLTYAYPAPFPSTGWNLEDVATISGPDGADASLALAGGAMPRIAFHDTATRRLRYATRTAANAWTVADVDAPPADDEAGDAGQYAALALDPSGNPHVAYKFRYSPDDQEGAAKHAYWDGGAWQVEWVETGNWAWGESLAVDNLGAIHVTYVMYASSADEQLRYARRTEGTGTPPAVPDTFIDTAPPRLTNSTATFTFHSDNPAATFECRNNAGAWLACTSPHNSSASNGDGAYTFFVRATAGGLTDPSPAFYTWTRDTTAPDSYISTGPDSPSTSSDATFTFRATDASPVTFRCRVVPEVYVPGDVWPDFQPCISPASFTGIDDGDWVFELMATDAAGNAETYYDAAFDWWTIDLPGPATTITAKPPALTNSPSATFSFTSDNPAATFQCQIDSGAWATCASPAGFTVSQGSHTFNVRATAAGQTDPVPATYSWTVDTTPPMAYIDTHPPLNDQLATATFTFHSNDATATFECRLNGSAYAACATPKTYTGLAAGNYTFHVRAVDPAGNASPTPASYSWYTAGPPQTSIYYPDPLPTYTTSTSISFLAASNKSGSTYQCKLDGGAFAACADGNGQSYTGLIPGVHTFAVRATDSLGQTDPTPATHTWTTDPYWPDTRLDGTPANPSNSGAPRFLFSSGSPGATFECRLDSGGWGVCATPKDYSGLANGSHTFEVRATSGAGIVDPTPAVYTWMIALAADTTTPSTTITQQPANPTNQARATYAFTSDDATATFECSFNDAPFVACVSPATYRGTYTHQLRFQVRARDDKGNVDASPADSVAVLQLDQEPGALALGQYHACALRPDGSVDCWGNSSNGKTSHQSGPYTAIAANDSATCGLRPDGSADCWGLANQGGTDQAGPFTQISGGAYSFCGVKSDNSVACWGWNANGQAANQSGPYTLVSGGTAHTCALKADGTITCWGDNNSGQLSAPTGAFYRLVSGYSHSCAMKNDGSVDCWGYGGYGQNADQSGPYAQLTAGNDHNCALKPDGSVDCWGRNDYGQAADQPGPFVAIAAGGHFTCALRADGSVDCWGINPDGRADDQDGPFGPTVFDTFAPDTRIDSGPAADTEATDAAFIFRGNEYGATFTCSLDGADYSVCASPQNYTGLVTGGHTFRVRATDTAGNGDASPAEHAWTINAVQPPETTITSAPVALTNSASASFTFSSSESDSTFECQLDSGSFAACASPKSYTGLSDGSHTFAVKAINSGGTADPTPASHTWTVDTTAPDTTLASTPANPSTSSDASFAFSSEAGATFECKLDAAAFAACVSPKSYTGLGDGSHTFSVRAKDAAGNTDASPATYTWTIDATPPDTTITGKPAATTASTSADFTFTGVDAISFECKLDSASFAACDSPKHYDNLANGSHTFEVRAKDSEGRYDPTPAGYTWAIDATGPETTITVKPNDPSNDPTPDFAFTSDDPDPDSWFFYCQTDANGWFPCGGSSITYYNLDEGFHTFRVKAEDAQGNQDPTPAEWSWTIDLTAPETTITARPSPVTNSTSATFQFSSEDGATFECKLDGATFAACTSPKSYTSLSDGSHTFSVRAKDAATNGDASPATFTWTIDTSAPDTTLTSTPPNPSTSNNAEFHFSSEAGATFECKLDGEAFATCTSPRSYTSLSDGSHTFTVRAKDTAGNLDPTPATFTWTVDTTPVDTTPPDTTIHTGPPTLTNNNRPSFTFSSDEADSTFECRLDASVWEACASPKEYSHQADGAHAFAARATDTAGNTDPTPANYGWTVDTTIGAPTLTGCPASPNQSREATLSFSLGEPATFECRLNSSGWASCTSPQSYTNLADDAYTFGVRATDPAGNVSSETPCSWTVDATPPETTITSPIFAVYNVDTITIEFSSETAATFQCALDGATWSDCASPKTYDYLADGLHTFAVRASDAAGNTDPTPAEANWTVDTPGPDTSLDSTPPDPSNVATATFTFSSADATHFECALDGATFAPCASPHTMTGLADGPHLFEVRAVNDQGKADATPAGYVWLVDTTPPSVTINQATGQPDPADDGPVHFTIHFTEPVNGFTDADVTLSGTAGATTAVVTNRHDQMEYDVAVSGMTGRGTVIATVAAYVATDAAGNANTASTADDNSVTYSPPPTEVIYITTAGPGGTARNTDGSTVAYTKGDILKWNGEAWTMWFRGTATGLPASADIFAFDVDDDGTGSVWLALSAAKTVVPGLGRVSANEIFYFDGQRFSRFFDGSDVGLKTSGERINGLEVLPGTLSPIGNGCLHYLLISTVAGGGVPVGATNVNFTGEDVLGFCMTSVGDTTAGQWHLVFEGQSHGLQKNNNRGLSANADATTLYFTAKLPFQAIPAGAIFAWDGTAFSGPLWLPANHGITRQVDGIDVAKLGNTN